MRLSGLNINAQLLASPVKLWLLGVLKKMNSLSHTTMDDWQFTLDASEMMPDTLWAHRSWNPFFVRDDTRTYLEKDPEPWARWVSNFEQRSNVYHHMLNEPTSDDVPKLVDWLIEAMRLTGRNGKYPQKCIVGNFAVDKSFQHQGDSIRWQDHWLRFYRELAKHQGWHKVGYHRYWIGDIRLAYVSGYPANIRLDYPTHADYQDPSKHKLSLERLPNGDLPPHWTGYADLWVKKLCIENNIPIVDEMITEDWLDEKRDPGTLPYNKYVDDNYPTAYDNGNGRGLWTWQAWSEASTNKPYIVSLKDQLEAKNKMHLSLEQQYPQLRGKQKGTHLFSFTPAEDWERAGHSVYTPPQGGGKYDIRLQLINVMTQISDFKDTPVTNPIDPSQYTMEAKVISTKSVTNIRDKHDATRGKVIYTLQGQDTLEVMISDVPLWEDDNKDFFWYRIEYNGQELFVADTKNLVRSDVPVTPPVDNPDTPDTPTSPPDGITAEQLATAVQTAVTAQFEALQAKVDELEAQIAEMLTPVMVDVPDVTYTLPKWAIPMKVAELKGEIRQREAQVIFLEGTPTPPATAQTLNPLTDNLPPAELDAQSFKPTLDDIDFQELNIPDMSVDTQGVVTFTNEIDDDTNEQTLTDIMLNGNDMPKHQIHFDEDDNKIVGTGDDDSEELPHAS